MSFPCDNLAPGPSKGQKGEFKIIGNGNIQMRGPTPIFNIFG